MSEYSDHSLEALPRAHFIAHLCLRDLSVYTRVIPVTEEVWLVQKKAFEESVAFQAARRKWQIKARKA